MGENSSVFWAAFGGGDAAGIFTLLAVVGAEWLRWWNDRPLLKVEASLGYILSDSKHSERQFTVEASNPHSRPVTITSFGLAFRRKEYGNLLITPQLGYQFPLELASSKSITQWTSMYGLLDELRKQQREPSDLKWVWFKVATGKEYRGRIPKWVIKELTEAFQN